MFARRSKCDPRLRREEWRSDGRPNEFRDPAIIYVAHRACGSPALCAEVRAHAAPGADVLVVAPGHALNLSEDAVRMQLFQRALLLLATALEGLIQSDTNRVAKQFRERLPQLAEEVGVAGVDEEFARDLYAARSEAAPGAQVSMFHVEPMRE